MKLQASVLMSEELRRAAQLDLDTDHATIRSVDQAGRMGSSTVSLSK